MLETSPYLLHPDVLHATPMVGHEIAGSMYVAAAETEEYALANKLADPDITVLIRTHNDNPEEIQGLFEDLNAQEFDGDVEKIIVDTAGSWGDETSDVAHRLGVKRVLPLDACERHTSAVSAGIYYAENRLVLSLIGHTRLASQFALRAATRYAVQEHFGAAYGVSLPGANASLSEKMGATILGVRKQVEQPAHIVEPGAKEMGLMAADCALINTVAYHDLRGFTRGYAAGGADGEFGQRLAHSRRYDLILDPVLSVHHTHGLKPVQALSQLQYWRSLDKPHEFGKTPGYDYCQDVDQRLRP